MIKSILLSLFVCLVLIGSAQNVEFAGNWILNKVNDNGDISAEKTNFKFDKNGIISTEGFEFGTWKFDAKAMDVELETGFEDDEFNGIYKVLELTKNKLVFTHKNVTYYFNRVDLEAITQNNKSSNLAGIWKLNHNDFEGLFLKLELPNIFHFISANSNTTTSERGEWSYLSESNELILSGIGGQFILDGKSRIRDHTSGVLALVRPNETLVFHKKHKSDIEWLSFSLEDFEDRENDEAKLPDAWKNDGEFITHLSKIQSLVYDYEVYVSKAEALKKSKILRKVEANISRKSVSIANILINKTDTMQFSENHKGNLMNTYNYFFPEQEPGYYRVAGSEKMDGYECTVVEGISGEKKVKYWMINNQPGVYAKIIEQGENWFSKEVEYFVMTLLKSY